MDLKIIDIAVNPDHVHLFIKYPPKYSISYLAKIVKSKSSRILRKEFPELRNGAGTASGHQVAIMVQLAMAGMLLKGTYWHICEVSSDIFCYRKFAKI